MTRTEQLLARRWRSALVGCVLVILTGAVIIIWARIDAEASRGTRLADEANLRGTAVSTLAGDVRALRAQVQAAGRTPVAPDPADAVRHLTDRAEVPVPIPGPPGPRGATGASGPPGLPAPAVTPVPGPEGSPGTSGVAGKPGTDGAAGADSTVPGPQGDTGPPGAEGAAGPPGPAGPPGADGQAGRDGQTCPAGYSLQSSPVDPYALVCRQDDAPTSPTPAPTSTPPAVVSDRRRN